MQRYIPLDKIRRGAGAFLSRKMKFPDCCPRRWRAVFHYAAVITPYTFIYSPSNIYSRALGCVKILFYAVKTAKRFATIQYNNV